MRAVAGAALLVAFWGAPVVVSRIRVPGLNESSGLAASRAHPGVLWSHNDSGGGPYVFAFERGGRPLGRWRVPAARANDWEDVAIAPGPNRRWFLWIGDIGDNDRRRQDITVYRIAEPDPARPGGETGPAAAIRLLYPDGPHDAECLMVHPRTGDLYIVTKATAADPATLVFKARAPLDTGRRTLLRRVAELDLPESALMLLVGRVTGGDIAPSGDRVVLCDYFAAWEAVLPAGARDFDAIWKSRWEKVPIGLRPQGESVCYRHDGRAILAGSEGAEFSLIEVVRAR